MTKTHPKVISVAETEQFLSEKSLMRGSVTLVALTNNRGFAAKNMPAYGQKVMLG